MLYFQGIEADGLRDQLIILAESLNKSRAMMHPPKTAKVSKLGEMLPGLSETVEKEHKRLLARKSIIEKRKEEQERLLLEMVLISEYLEHLGSILMLNFLDHDLFLMFGLTMHLIGARGGIEKAKTTKVN